MMIETMGWPEAIMFLGITVAITFMMCVDTTGRWPWEPRGDEEE